MKKTTNYIFGIIILFGSLLITSCKDKNKSTPIPSSPSIEDYDRNAMLTNLANNYIIPAYSEYSSNTAALKTRAAIFVATPSIANLESLQTRWETTLLTWQDVAFLEFGPASAISLRGQTNVYPTDTLTIQANVNTGTYDLQTADNFDAKGLQAVDYLINGTATDNQAIVNYYDSISNAGEYLNTVIEELDVNASIIAKEWINTYSATFISNSASNAQGSSVSNVVNALSLHYEGYVRKGKVGLPLGAFNTFSEETMPDHVEAYYYGQSLPFLLRSITSMQTFLNGQSYISQSTGKGLNDYICFVEAKSSNGEALQTVIDNKLIGIKAKIASINDPLSKEIDSNTQGVTDLYTLLQQLVPPLKVELSDALGVLITYQDTDGD